MSTENKTPVQSVESLREALSQAQALVLRLESELVAAEESAATAAVIAMVESGSSVIPPEPVPFFGSDVPGNPDYCAPQTCSSKVFVEGLARDGEFTGGVSAFLRAYPNEGGGWDWAAFFYVAGYRDGFGYLGSGTWEFAVGLLFSEASSLGVGKAA